MAHDVFISYSTKDKTIADAVCARLEEYKIRAWIAPRDIPAGANFGQSIIRAINTCKVFILIWSTDTNTSEHILNEINQAFDQGITIIPFRIQNVLPTDEMRYYFGRTHWLDAIDPPLENHIKTLRDTILVNLGRELQPAPPAPLPDQSSKEIPEEPSPEEESAIKKTEAAKPPVGPPRQKKSPKTDPEIRLDRAAPKKFKKYIPYAAGGLVLITLIVLLISGVFKGSPPARTAQSSPPSTSASQPTESTSPTKTVKPTAAATTIPAWEEKANQLADPILAAINALPPDFADDFSQVDPGWDYWDGGGGTCAEHPTPNLNIAEGSMKINIESNCHVRIDHPFSLSHAADFVYQVDLIFSPTSIFEIGLESQNQHNLGYALSSGSWEITARKPNSEEWQVEQSGNSQIDPSTPAAFMIMKIDTTILFFVNSVLLTSYELQAEDADGLEIFFVAAGGNTGKDILELDNVKYWDLDRLDIANHFQASDQVDEAIAISEPILAAVKDTPPDFEDDFSIVDPSWVARPDIDGCDPEEDTTLTISNGSLKYSIKNCQVGNLQSNNLMPEDYVLQVDLIFPETDLTFGVRNWVEDGLVDFYLNSPSGHVGSNIMAQEEFIEMIEVNYQLDFSKPIKLTIINQSPAFLVYADSTLLIANLTNQIYQGPFILDFTIEAGNPSTLTKTLVMDNLKLWSLAEKQ